MPAACGGRSVPVLIHGLGRCVLMAGVFLWAMTTLAADPVVIEPSLDRNPVPINESFTLTLASSIEPDGEPDYSPLLAHFEILNQTRGSSYKMINGSILRKYTWQVQLMAKEAGTLEIPPIAFGKDLSPPLKVTIVWSDGARTRAQGGSPGGDAPGLLVELDASPRNPYVQAQVIVTVRVLSRIAFSGDLGQPEVPGILLEKLDPDRQYTASRNGLQYRVDERRYALFPQKSGALTLPAVDLTGEYVDPSNPFPRPGSKKFRLRTESLNLDVRPIPKAFTGSTWLPATKLTLREAYKPDSGKVAVGEALTRNLSLRAEGASSGVLPELEGSPPDFKSYPDQPVLREDKGSNGLTGVREQKIALIPLKPGSFESPAIDVPWWNTVEDRQEVAHLPARTLTVVGSDKAPVAAPEPPSPETTVRPSPEPAAASESPVETASRAAVPENPWVWSTVGLSFLWLLTLAVVWWRWPRGAHPQGKDAGVSLRPASSALPKVKAAARANDPRAAHAALMALSLECWPEQAVEARLAALRARLGAPMADLERALYGGATRPFSGEALWAAVERESWEPVAADRDASELAPLYPP